MSDVSIDFVRAFPVDSPILPESRQIGRRAFIDSLYRRVVDELVSIVLRDDRRVGKTSAAFAVTERARAAGGAALDLDLSDGRIGSGQGLATAIARGARDANLAVIPIVPSPRKLGLRSLARATETAVNDAELTDAIVPLADILAAATSPDEHTLQLLLERIATKATAARETVVIFIDEFQNLAEWPDGVHVQEVIARAMHRPNSPIVFIFAGSEKRMLADVFAVGQPLHHDGIMCPVPGISRADWIEGLTARFAERGISISEALLDQVLAVSQGHPQDTMRVCSEIDAAVHLNDAKTVTDLHIGIAITRAKGHPSWAR